MAKCVGFVGTIRGKVGTTVFTKGENGLSYARTYQPQVSNPKSVGQREQRAKMNLVGRLSQITPKDVLIGMASTGRARRSEFTSNLLHVATIDQTQRDTMIASINPEDIIFSKGAETLNAEVTTQASVNASSVSLSLTLSNTDLVGRYGERIVVLVIDPKDKGGYSMVRSAEVLFVNTAAVTVNIGFGSALEDESMVVVYRLPFVLTDSGASFVTEGLSNNAENVIAKVLTMQGAVRGWGLSSMSSKQVFRNA